MVGPVSWIRPAPALFADESLLMIQHVLLFSFLDGVDETSRRALLDALRDFPARFPQMRHWQLGPNISERDQSYQYAMTVQFERRTDLDAYLRSDYHERFVVERFRPVIKQRAIATIEI
jgi:hypothetical protein